MKEKFEEIFIWIKENEFDEEEWYCAYPSEKLSVIKDAFTDEFGEDIFKSQEYKNWIKDVELREF